MVYYACILQSSKTETTNKGNKKMSDYQTTAELAQEACEENAHLRAKEEAERRWVIEAERTAANGGFSPAEPYDYDGREEDD